MEHLLLQLLLVEPKRDFAELYQSISINQIRKKYVFLFTLFKNTCAYNYMWIAIQWVCRIDMYHSNKILCFVWIVTPLAVGHLMQDIPRNLYGVHDLICFFILRYELILPLSFRVTSLALGQSYDCPSASNVTLEDMAKRNPMNMSGTHDITTTKQSTTNTCILHGTYCRI